MGISTNQQRIYFFAGYLRLAMIIHNNIVGVNYKNIVGVMGYIYNNPNISCIVSFFVDSQHDDERVDEIRYFRRPSRINTPWLFFLGWFC